MTRALQVALCLAAKELGYGVTGVKPEIAREFQVPIATFVQEGRLIPGSQSKAKTSGYYCPRSNPLGVPKLALSLHEDDAPEKNVYTLYTVAEDRTWLSSFAGRHEGRHAKEALAYLRGIADGASERQSRKR